MELPVRLRTLRDFRKRPDQVDHSWSSPRHKVFRRAMEQLEVEAINWHAWHRLENFDAPGLPGGGSRQVVVDFVCNALEQR
jgi:hypothetical protein